MTNTVAIRNKTGEKCTVSGIYQFDGYLDGSTTPQPTPAETQEALSVPNVFPPIRSTRKGCWWKLVRRS
jgi:hypothetical protein